MKASNFVFVLCLCIGLQAFAQKKGNYLSEGDPLANLWEFAGDPQESAPLVQDIPQQFIFLLSEGSAQSMLGAFEIEGNIACPSYCTASSDLHNLYLEIGESCIIELSEDQRFLTLPYAMSKDGSELQITLDGKNYRYTLWRE